MWTLSFPWWEYILRSVIIYAAVFVLLRFFGHKQIAEMGAFDLVLLLILSESVSSAITGGDNSVPAALISVATFVAMNRSVDLIMHHSRKMERLLDGSPKTIIKDGHINENICKSEFITQEELLSSLRQNGLEDPSVVKKAVLETNGKISVLR